MTEIWKGTHEGKKLYELLLHLKAKQCKKPHTTVLNHNESYFVIKIRNKSYKCKKNTSDSHMFLM